MEPSVHLCTQASLDGHLERASALRASQDPGISRKVSSNEACCRRNVDVLFGAYEVSSVVQWFHANSLLGNLQDLLATCMANCTPVLQSVYIIFFVFVLGTSSFRS